MSAPEFPTRLNFEIYPPDEAACWIANDLKRIDELDLSVNGRKITPGVEIAMGHVNSVGTRSLRFRDRDGGANVSILAEVLAAAQKKFGLTSVWSFQWANDCTESLPDVFGGGAVVIADGKIMWMSTSSWVAKHEDRVLARRREKEEVAERIARLNGRGKR